MQNRKPEKREKPQQKSAIFSTSDSLMRNAFQQNPARNYQDVTIEGQREVPSADGVVRREGYEINPTGRTLITGSVVNEKVDYKSEFNGAEMGGEPQEMLDLIAQITSRRPGR